VAAPGEGERAVVGHVVRVRRSIVGSQRDLDGIGRDLESRQHSVVDEQCLFEALEMLT